MSFDVLIQCDHDPDLDCGCYMDADDKVQRHPFRFFDGDRVRHVTWRGFTGTVLRGGISPFVKWDEIPGLGSATPSAFQSNFEIEHLEE